MVICARPDFFCVVVGYPKIVALSHFQGLVPGYVQVKVSTVPISSNFVVRIDSANFWGTLLRLPSSNDTQPWRSRYFALKSGQTARIRNKNVGSSGIPGKTRFEVVLNACPNLEFKDNSPPNISKAISKFSCPILNLKGANDDTNPLQTHKETAFPHLSTAIVPWAEISRVFSEAYLPRV